MANGPEYILAPAVSEVLDKVLKRCRTDITWDQFQAYAGLIQSRFTCVQCVRSAPTHNGMKNVAKIQSIAEPVSLLTPIRYIVTVYNGGGDWDNLSEEQKELVILHELMHVDLEHEFEHPDWDRLRAGRLLGHNLNDFKKMVEVFGVDWFQKAGAAQPVKVEENVGV